MKGKDLTKDPIPVFIDNRGYGLLWPMDPTKPGCGHVQLGSGGPWEDWPLDDMEPVTQEEFDDWLYERTEPHGNRKRPKAYETVQEH